jgi:hypothetical protein
VIQCKPGPGENNTAPDTRYRFPRQVSLRRQRDVDRAELDMRPALAKAPAITLLQRKLVLI